MNAQQEYRRLLYTFDTLSDLSQQAVEARELHSSARSLLYLVLGAVGIRRGLLLEFQPESKRLFAVAAKGVDLTGLRSCSFTHEDARALVQRAMPLAVIGRNGARPLPGPLTPYLREHQCRLAIPLVVRRRLAGVLATGGRLNGEDLTEHERGALLTMARYVGVILVQHALVGQLRTAMEENLRLYGAISETYLDTVQAFGTAIDAKDVYTRGHSQRVARYCCAMAERHGLAESTREGVRIGSYLHDIGKIVLDRSLINKPDRLSEEEFREVASHTVIGHEVLSRVRFPWPEVPSMVRSHHERVDGNGYPDRLAGEQIPLYVRMLTVADAFDAMTTDRPYRSRLPAPLAMNELVRCSGSQFDPLVVKTFLGICREEVTGSAPRRVFSGVLERGANRLSARTLDGLMRKLEPAAKAVRA